ncbi:g10673 [Coccomyxa elongata]
MSESDRDQAIQLLNDAKLATDANQKVDLLKGLAELIVHKQPSLLSEFLPEVTLLQTEPAVPVRKQLVELLEAAVRAQPSLAALTAVLGTLRQLLDDSSPAVVRRSLAACSIAFRPGHSAALALGKGPSVPPDVAAVWEACVAIRQKVSQLVAEPVSDGVRLTAIKFMEFVIMLLTAESAPKGPLALANHALLNPAQVARDAEALLLQLLAMVKQSALVTLPGSVAIVVVKAVGSIAAQRPQYLGRVLPTLLSAASASSANDAADEQNGVVASVDRAVRDGLMSVLRCKAPQALPWQRKIVAALYALGAGEQAEAEVRRSERQAKRERARQEDDSSAPASSKRQRSSTEAVQPEPAQAAPAIAGPLPQPLLPPLPQQEETMLMRLLHECPDHTSERDLREVLAVMAVLAAENDFTTLKAFVAELSDAVLADAVIANLDHLPRREDVCDGVPAPVGPGGLAGLIQGLTGSVEPAQQPQQPLPQPQMQQEPELQPQLQPPLQPPLAVVPKREAPVPQTKVPPEPRRQLALRRAALPVLELKPLPLTAQQASSLRLDAVRRVVAADAAPVQHLRASVLASLATRAPVGDMAADMVLAHLLGTFHQPKGYTLALQWLYRLFVAHAGISVTSAAEAAARAHITQPERKAALASVLDDDMVVTSAEDVALPAPAALDEVMAEAGPPNIAGRSPTPEQAASSAAPEQAATSAAPDQAASLAAPDQAQASAAPEQAASSAQPEQATVAAAPDQAVGCTVPDQDAAGNAAVCALEVREAGSKEEGSRDWDTALVGSQYEIVLLAMLEGLREQQTDPKDRTIARLLLDAPALPQPAVAQFLADVAAGGTEWATLALSAAFDVVMGRPCDRAPVLDMVLSTATAQDEDIRTKAVRLTANRLFREAFLQAAIEDFAWARLRELMPPPKAALPAPDAAPAHVLENGSAAPNQAQAAAPATPLENGVAAAEAPAAAQSEPPTDSNTEQQQNGGQVHNSTSASSGIEQSRQPPGHITASAKNGATTEHESASRGEQDESSGRPEAAELNEQAMEEADARRESGRLASTSDGVATLGREWAVQGSGSTKAGGTAAVAAAAAGGGPAVPAAGADHLGGKEEAQRRCDLFCALCTKKPQLLRKLLMVYGKAPESARGAIKERAPGLARVVGAASPDLAELLRQRLPPGSLPLLLSMLHTLTESKPPPASLVAACMEALERTRDVRFLVPALAGLSRQEALVHLPKLLTLKDTASFTAGIQRLLLPQPVTGEPLLAPQEILVQILTLKKEACPVKQHIAALTACLTMKLPDGSMAFPSQSLASTLQQLVVRKPLPYLFMRFTIQANAASRELRGFVLDILSMLVGQAVWADIHQWQGWIVCVQQLLPDSLPVLLQLPLRNLGLALDKMPPKVAVQAAEFVASGRGGPLPRQTVALIQDRAAHATAKTTEPVQASQPAA